MAKTQKKVEAEIPQDVQPVELPPFKDKAVKIRNAGERFPCDLRTYGYGMRWPTNAVYVIPLSVYLELLKQGFNGTYV